MPFNWNWFLPALTSSIQETLVMVGVSLLFAVILGIPLGIILVVTREGGILQNKGIFNILNIVINVFRSLPFIILIVAIIPFTRFIVGTSIGTAATIVPLVIFTAPYIGRLVENSLLEVDQGVTELAQAMGATPWQTIWRFLVPEALGSIILSLTIATIGLIGASAMAGAVGGGGLGNLAITYGYQQFQTQVMIITVILLIIFVQLIQMIGNYAARKIRRN